MSDEVENIINFIVIFYSLALQAHLLPKLVD